ncbi:ATP-binding protein [uncultured Polaribacter sp.]|uniref:sensor histidine kinase n=1 Tax=uncultured Polaribacter sp. TaxID=174711 RepID=UPI002617B530|nr:ATP-binding protein [uncultured Polaribacter sp.]
MESLFSEENQIIVIIITAVLVLLLMAAALLGFFFVSRKKIIAKELEKKTLVINHQKESIQAIIVTQENERTRIAQDLHDDISSKLNVINLNANLLIDGSLDATETLFINKKILEITHKSLQSARKIAHNLLPPVLSKLGLKPAIEELCDDFNSSKKVTISYTVHYVKESLSSQRELHLFRILQELINNSIRHGKATKIDLNFEERKQSFIFEYSDNGIGFNVEETLSKKGLGLTNIENRVAILQGKMHLKSAINKGFNILISLENESPNTHSNYR